MGRVFWATEPVGLMTEKRATRDTFSFMRGNILVLTATRVLGMFCRRMVFPYASLYILALGGDSTQIGFINSLRPLAGLVMFPLAGYITDRAGRVRLIALSGYFSGAVMLLYVFAPSWEWLALGTLLQGFMVFQFPPTSAIIADSLTPENRGMGIATMNTVATGLAMFSPYIAGALLEIYDVDSGMRVLYGLLVAASVVSATINLRFLRETSRVEEELDLSNLTETLRDVYGGIPSTLRRLPRSIKALSAVTILGFMANGVSSPFWVVYAVERIGLSSVEWGFILLVEAALKTLLYIPAGALVDRYGRARCINASLLLSLVSIPVFVLSSRFIEVLLIRMAIAVISALFIPASSALMADTVPREMRGRVMAAIGRGSVMVGAAGGGTGGPGMGFVVTLPVMVASIAGGYLYAVNPAYPWVFVLATIIAQLMVSALYIRDPVAAEV